MKPVSVALVALLAAPIVASASTWELDSGHSTTGFSVRHLMVSNVLGTFGKTSAIAHFDDKEITLSSVEATIDAASIDTRDAKRDEHLRGADFFDVANHPKLTFKSTKVEKAGAGHLRVLGDLSIHGVTKPVVLEVNGPSEPVKTPWGQTRLGLSASTKISRKDFGLTWNKALEKGGVIVGDEVTISIEAEFAEQAPKAAAK